MTAKILEEIGTLAQQRLILPGYYTWEQFEAIEIIPISLLDLCVNQGQSIVIGGPRNSLFLTADEGR